MDQGPAPPPDAGAPPPAPAQPPKRGPGRPKGSRNRPRRTEPTPAEGPAARAPARGALSSAVAQDLAELSPNERAGLRIWQWLSAREFALWPSVVAELHVEQKAALCLHLLTKGHAAVTIANKLGLMPHFVKDVWRDYTAKLGDDVMGITMPSLVGRIEAHADSLREMAVEDGRPDRAWKIEKERVEMLQDLGVVERAAKRYEIAHQHTVKADPGHDQEMKSEMDRLLELERKQKESVERVKRINARVLDHLPDQETRPKEEEEE